MKLGKLLWLGKSFFGNGDSAAYRMNRRACLPTFNAGKNPFVAKAPAAEAPEEAEKAVTPASVPVQKAPPPYAFKPVHTGRRGGAAPVAATPVAAAPSAPVAKPAKAGWTTRLNPFRAPEPEPEAATVQTELSLDSVKVMHNDLADADVEVVPVKAHANAEVAAPVLPPARRAWEYVGENLMKS